MLSTFSDILEGFPMEGRDFNNFYIKILRRVDDSSDDWKYDFHQFLLFNDVYINNIDIEDVCWQKHSIYDESAKKSYKKTWKTAE